MANEKKQPFFRCMDCNQLTHEDMSTWVKRKYTEDRVCIPCFEKVLARRTRDKARREAKRAVPAEVPAAVLVSKPLPPPEPPRPCANCHGTFPWFSFTARPYTTAAGLSIEALVCHPCAEKLDESAKPEPLTVKRVLEALEREDFHFDDLLDAVKEDVVDGDHDESARTRFVRALLDRLTDGDLAVELAFRLGEIADPFKP